MTIHQRLHKDRISDERLAQVWESAYEGYSECWDQDALENMAADGEDICSALEELADLRAEVKRLAAQLEQRNKYVTDTMDAVDVKDATPAQK